MPGMSCGSAYEVLRALGRGSIAETYLAKQRGTGETVVLTCSDFAHSIGDPPSEDAFAARVARLRGIKVEGLPRVIGGGKDGAVYWIAAQHIEGPDVRAFTRRRPVQAKLPVVIDTVSTVMVAANTLAEAAAKGVTHGDLMPKCIVLGPGEGGFDPVVLSAGYADLFGLDRRAARESPLYRAPEQLCDGTWDQRSDIYSLGMIMVELITGAVPFTVDGVAPRDADLLVLAERGVPESVTDPTGCPPYVARFVQRAIHKDPRRRFQTWLQLQAALAGVITLLLDDPTVKAFIEADDRTREARRAAEEDLSEARTKGSLPVEGGPTTVPPSAGTKGRIAREVARVTAAALAGEPPPRATAAALAGEPPPRETIASGATEPEVIAPTAAPVVTDVQETNPPAAPSPVPGTPPPKALHHPSAVDIVRVGRHPEPPAAFPVPSSASGGTARTTLPSIDVTGPRRRTAGHLLRRRDAQFFLSCRPLRSRRSWAASSSSRLVPGPVTTSFLLPRSIDLWSRLSRAIR